MFSFLGDLIDNAIVDNFPLYSERTSIALPFVIFFHIIFATSSFLGKVPTRVHNKDNSRAIGNHTRYVKSGTRVLFQK